ncbi:hypothetical protein [Fibrobacter sp. UWB11]|uniref:hypothetical protein n=1 Tax=Fibrobacter sp. UWB11 TaxID=1896202 RepID=UPI0009280486|nr:hypothetical protein [Fibrobacter sp. UWB11]SIN84114.1 hypothetical protein SAMN05720758_0183 [Fibrobacter sp. UWB11]
MINKISFVVCLLLVLDVYACKVPQRGRSCAGVRVKTCLGIHDNIACARLDPKFKDFENFFDIEKVRTDRRLDGLCEDIGKSFTFDVTPKAKIPLESIIFRFYMAFADSSFRESPIDVVESFKKMVATIHKNPSFEKWLERNARERAEKKEPGQSLVYENIAVINNQKDIYVQDYGWEPIENIWNKIGMSSKYIGALAFCKTPDFCSRVVRCGFPKFLLGDNGDVFFPKKWNLKKENILDVSQNEIASYASLKQYEDPKTSKGILSYIEDFLCNHSLVSEDRCKEWRSKYYKYCNYLIIRHDGSIEYGPKSRDL